MQSFVTTTARVGMIRDEPRSVINEFVLAQPNPAQPLFPHVLLEVKASWTGILEQATVWLMAGSSSELYQIAMSDRPTPDDLVNLGVALVARSFPMYHPLAEELGY